MITANVTLTLKSAADAVRVPPDQLDAAVEAADIQVRQCEEIRAVLVLRQIAHDIRAVLPAAYSLRLYWEDADDNDEARIEAVLDVNGNELTTNLDQYDGDRGYHAEHMGRRLGETLGRHAVEDLGPFVLPA